MEDERFIDLRRSAASEISVGKESISALISLDASETSHTATQVGLWHLNMDDLATGGRTNLTISSSGAAVALAQDPHNRAQAQFILQSAANKK